MITLAFLIEVKIFGETKLWRQICANYLSFQKSYKKNAVSPYGFTAFLKKPSKTEILANNEQAINRAPAALP